MALFKDFGVEVVEFELPPDFAIHVYRFHLYLGFVNLNLDSIRGIAVSDIKDVAVQVPRGRGNRGGVQSAELELPSGGWAVGAAGRLWVG